MKPHIRFRQWIREGMVTSSDGQFLHKTKRPTSIDLFRATVIALGGEIVSNCADNFGYHLTNATLPPAAADQVLPDPSPGGRRSNPGGRPSLPADERRRRQSARLSPETRPLAEAIAEALDLNGWGRAVDEAVKRLAEELRII